MQCPYCKKQVPSDALICPHCGKSLVLDASFLPQQPVDEQSEERIDPEVVVPEKDVSKDITEEKTQPVDQPKQETVEEAPIPQKIKKERAKPRHQFGKSILILALTILSVFSFILLKIVTPDAAMHLINSIKENEALRIINYVLIFIPTTMIFIMGQLGWGFILIIAGITILASLLVMIRATKTKKFLLLGIIALNVALIISAIIMYWH